MALKMPIDFMACLFNLGLWAWEMRCPAGVQGGGSK
jgi:hypothetical protein